MWENLTALSWFLEAHLQMVQPYSDYKGESYVAATYT